MVKLNDNEREKILECIKTSGIGRKEYVKMKKHIKENLGLDIDVSQSILYMEKAFKAEWIKILKSQNELMVKWNKSETVEAPKSEDYAEKLYDLVHNNDNQFLEKYVKC